MQAVLAIPTMPELPSPSEIRQLFNDELQRAQLLWSIGQRDQADRICRTLLALDSRCGPAWYQLALSKVVEGQISPGIELLKRAVDSGIPVVRQLEFAHFLLTVHQEEVAIPVLLDAHRAAPEDSAILVALGRALQRVGRIREAEPLLQRALSLSPDRADVRSSLAGVLRDMGRYPEAMLQYQAALELAPDELRVASSLLWTASHLEDLNAADLYAQHTRLGAMFARTQHSFRRPASTERRPLRVGFVSADFRQHAVAFFLKPVWRGLDRQACTIHAYSNMDVADHMTAELRGLADQWRDVRSLDDDNLAARIRADGIDILVDLSGHAAGNRLPVFARRAAPVQVSWMYPCTTGVPGMDYLVGDDWLTPRGALDHAFTEKLIRLPAACAFEPLPGLPAVSPLPALENGRLTFGSFHRPAKLTRGTLDCWAAVLRALPESKLLMAHCDEEATADSMRNFFQQQGIDENRLDFRPRLKMDEYLRLHHEVDIALDAFGYSGGTTSLHALLMGVPILSVAGETVPARQSTTILHHVGLEEFVADSKGDLVRLAIEWHGKIDQLSELRAHLRQRLLALPLVVENQVPRAFATAMRAVFERWSLGQGPSALSVTSEGAVRWDSA